MESGNNRLATLLETEPPASSVSAEAIAARIETLKAERQSLLNNCNAYNGAISECERWLAVLNGEDAT